MDRTCASMRHPSPCRDKIRHLTTEPFKSTKIDASGTVTFMLAWRERERERERERDIQRDRERQRQRGRPRDKRGGGGGWRNRDKDSKMKFPLIDIYYLLAIFT